MSKGFGSVVNTDFVRLTNISGYFFLLIYEGWNFNSGDYLFTTDTK